MNLPTLKIRQFSTDQYILDKCLYSNSYHLKGISNPEEAPIVVDVGGHCGYFTFAALSLGAKLIYAFEPFIDNYKILLSNIGEAGDKVIPYQLGVYVKDDVLSLNYPKITEGSYYDFANLSEAQNEKSIKCPCLSLDKLMDLAIEDIDILKINLGYAEIDILLASKNLFAKVGNMVLETSEDRPKIEDFILKMKALGYKDVFEEKVSEDGRTLIIISKESCKKYFNI